MAPKKRKKIRVSIKKLAQGLMPGIFKSGQSSSRGIVVTGKRKFIPGRDSISSYDWTSMFKARPEVYVREKKRNASLMVVADISSSLYFSSIPERTKMDLVLLFLEIAFDFAKDGNLAGVITFDSKVREFQSPYGPGAIQEIIEEVLNRRWRANTSSFTDLRPALKLLNSSLSERALVLVVSDFNFKANYFKELRTLGDYHDVIPVIINDPQDNISALIGNYFLARDMETGKSIYVRKIEKDQKHLSLFNKAGLDYFEVSTKQTEEQICIKLNEFFERRKF